MAELAKKHSERINDLKKKVEESYEYFEDNVKRYHDYMRFVFKSSLTDDEASTLADNGMPTLEFNILESQISRLRGEFAKQQPSLTVRAADGIPASSLTREFTETISVIEGHLYALFFDGTNDMLEYDVFSDLLGGGFSVMHMDTEYVNEKSFEQKICLSRVFNPTMTVFDALARESHKGDGAFCGEIYPMTKEKFIEEFGKEALDGMRFTKSLGSFDWSFTNDTEEIVLVCDFYEKQQKKETIYKLSNGHTVTKKEYEYVLKMWEEKGIIEQPPVIIKERKTMVESIVRYRFCETKVLDYTETNYKYLPLIFVDGNSVILKESGAFKQVTRPYVYHAKGIQRLKNFAGEAYANELENLIQHKFIVALESIPEEYESAYQNVQKADTLIYKYFLDTNNPTVTLPPPREVTRTPIPPQIGEAFRISDEMTQTILGNYDSSAGVNSAQMSGIAFARSAIQSNNASVPYVVGYIKGLNRAAQIAVDLIPKYYLTPRTIPILKQSGKREYVDINQPGSLYMNYDSNSLQVRVEAGVNFAMQKEIALQTIIAMSQANQGFAEFFNEEGLPILLDNIEVRGIDELKEKANDWMKKRQQQQQQQMQQQQQQLQIQAQQQAMQIQKMQQELQSPTPEQLGAMAIEQKATNDAANIAIKEREAETKFLEVMSKIKNEDINAEIKAAQIDAEQTRSAVDMAINLSRHHNELESKETE